jgi:hypothetical protein
MFVNDPNSPFYSNIAERRKDSKQSKSIFIKQAGLDTGEFVYRHRKDTSLLSVRGWTGGALLGNPGRGLGSAGKYGLKGSLVFGLPIAAYRGMSAPRGKAIGNAMGGFAGSILGPTLGAFLGGPVGSFIGAALLSEPIERLVSGTVNRFATIAKDNNSLHAGGNYKDTQIAYTMRQRAAQDMSTSLLNARQYLGHEAMLGHE